MNKLHDHEKEQFKTLFRQSRIKNFDDRFRILDVFLSTEKHVTVDEMVKLLKQNGINLSPAVVEETLDFMCRYGFAKASVFDNGKPRYEHRHLGHHHDHMVCGRCRKIIEFENEVLENLQKEIANAYGFHLLQHKMELYGICDDCLKEADGLKPLAAGRTGEFLVIKEFAGGKKATMHLMSMGLRIGDTIQIITNNGGGQMVLAVENCRLILGRGLAQKVMVKQV